MRYYLHQIPGRVRVKSPQVRGNPEARGHLNRLFGETAGIRDIAVNTLTGSILITFDQRLTSGEIILEQLNKAGLFDPALAVSGEQYLQAAAARAGEKLGKMILQATLERTLQGSPLGLLAVLL